jgi:hypothetical protein
VIVLEILLKHHFLIDFNQDGWWKSEAKGLSWLFQVRTKGGFNNNWFLVVKILLPLKIVLAKTVHFWFYLVIKNTLLRLSSYSLRPLYKRIEIIFWLILMSNPASNKVEKLFPRRQIDEEETHLLKFHVLLIPWQKNSFYESEFFSFISV